MQLVKLLDTTALDNRQATDNEALTKAEQEVVHDGEGKEEMAEGQDGPEEAMEGEGNEGDSQGSEEGEPILDEDNADEDVPAEASQGEEKQAPDKNALADFLKFVLANIEGASANSTLEVSTVNGIVGSVRKLYTDTPKGFRNKLEAAFVGNTVIPEGVTIDGPKKARLPSTHGNMKNAIEACLKVLQDTMNEFCTALTEPQWCGEKSSTGCKFIESDCNGEDEKPIESKAACKFAARMFSYTKKNFNNEITTIDLTVPIQRPLGGKSKPKGCYTKGPQRIMNNKIGTLTRPPTVWFNKQGTTDAATFKGRQPICCTRTQE